jgi:hypothetical protein
MVNGVGAVFRGFQRSQFRVTFRPDDETVAGHRRRTGCADILGARASGPQLEASSPFLAPSGSLKGG